MTIVIVKEGFMASDVRKRMVEGAALLLARNGLDGTSFSDVLELTGAPRGSVYHHFPNGKDQLVASAVEFAGDNAISLLEAQAGSSALDITKYFLHIWREVLRRSDFQSGCAVLAVTVATDSPDLLARTSTIFRAWRASLAALLVTGGLAKPAASRFAATLVASCEGAVVMARAERSLDPFELVAEQLLQLLEQISDLTPNRTES